MRTLHRVVEVIVSVGLLVLVVTAWVWFVKFMRSPEPPAEPPPGVVLRRLEIRLSDPLDKSGARGDRYRLFECREVPRP